MKQHKEISPIDKHVGSRMRMRRSLLGMSQDKLADALGITFQQVQKYEKGSNRMGASRLWDASKVLRVDISFFFEGLQDQKEATDENAMLTRSELSVVSDLRNIQDAEVRKKMLGLIRNVARL